MFDIGRKFTVSVPGRGDIKLGPSDHVASGGEGHVYRSGKLCVKIWDDTDKAVRDRMEEKVKLLAALTHPSLIVPESHVLDSNSRTIGYVMPWKEGWALPLAFTMDWRGRNGFSEAKALSFMLRMKEVTEFVHARNVIMGDANELNIIGKDDVPYYIDTDAWCIGNFRGDKILPTIMDYHSVPFSRDSDWFAWAVVTFQLMTGIHPYRGTHPGFTRTDMEGRMRANASVFDAGVRMAPAVRPFSGIPPTLLAWYKEVFMNGLRTPPPSPHAGTATAVSLQGVAVPVTRQGNLVVTRMYASRAPLFEAAADVLMLDDGTLISLSTGREICKADADAAYGLLNDGSVSALRTAGDTLEFGWSSPSPGISMHFNPVNMAAAGVWSADNRLFAIVKDGIQSMTVQTLMGDKKVFPGRKWALNPHATVFGTGIAIMDALGAKWAVVPFGGTAVAVTRVRELDGYRVMGALRKGNTAIISLIDKTGSWHRAELIMSADFSSVTVIITDSDTGTLNDAITENGIVVGFVTGNRLNLHVPGSAGRKEADASGLTDSRLFTGPGGVFIFRNGEVSKLSLT